MYREIEPNSTDYNKYDESYCVHSKTANTDSVNMGATKATTMK